MQNLIKAKTSTNTAILTSAGTALAANEARMSYKIQNLGTNPLFVKEGASASTSDFSYILAAGTGADNGTGAVEDESSNVVYVGIITVAGTSPRFVAVERTQD